MNISTANMWRLKLFVAFVAIWTLVIGLYVAIAQLAGGLTALVEKVYGDGWSAFTLIIGVGALISVGIGAFWLSDTERTRGMSAFWAIVGVTIVVIAALAGSEWITWAWSILWTLPLGVPLLLGAWLSVWAAENIEEAEAEAAHSNALSIS